MRKIIRGYAKDKDGNLVLVGAIPVPHNKDKPSSRERHEKRHLINQGATIFKKEIIRSIGRASSRVSRCIAIPRGCCIAFRYSAPCYAEEDDTGRNDKQPNEDDCHCAVRYLGEQIGHLVP